jgi:hypothetical protein
VRITVQIDDTTDGSFGPGVAHAVVSEWSEQRGVGGFVQKQSASPLAAYREDLLVFLLALGAAATSIAALLLQLVGERWNIHASPPQAIWRRQQSHADPSSSISIHKV